MFHEKIPENLGSIGNSFYLCNDYEKNRNEKIRNMENPFKFGTIVEEEFFTDRVEEVEYIEQFMKSANHLLSYWRVDAFGQTAS